MSFHVPVDRGSLHLHMIVWLTGAMSSETLREAFVSRGEEFRRRFYAFAESVSTQCYPSGTHYTLPALTTY
jgi:hypothetical protein